MAPPELPVRTLARVARLLERSCGDLTLPQYRLLAMVGDGNERATALAGRLALTKPSVSTMVDALVDRGFLVRAREVDDRRAVRLALTPTGRRTLRAAEASMQERLRPVVEHCPDPGAIRARSRSSSSRSTRCSRPATPGTGHRRGRDDRRTGGARRVDPPTLALRRGAQAQGRHRARRVGGRDGHHGPDPGDREGHRRRRHHGAPERALAVDHVARRGRSHRLRGRVRPAVRRRARRPRRPVRHAERDLRTATTPRLRRATTSSRPGNWSRGRAATSASSRDCSRSRRS